MDTTTITDPISRVGHHIGDRLPTGSIVATVTDVTSDLADQISDHVGDIDFAGTARQTRRRLAQVVPWMSVGPTRRFPRRWVVVAMLAAVVVAAAIIVRRRSGGPTEPPSRDDWSTGSANGTSPSADARRSDRQTATTNA